VHIQQASQAKRYKRSVYTKKVRLSGIVIPTDWDEEGNAMTVALSTAFENIGLRADKVSRDELLRLLQKEVEITGILVVTGANKTIAVEKFRLKKSWQ
jgi:5S rRNA maturation endonuclease (ribonuclease M5)